MVSGGKIRARKKDERSIQMPWNTGGREQYERTLQTRSGKWKMPKRTYGEVTEGTKKTSCWETAPNSNGGGHKEGQNIPT